MADDEIIISEMGHMGALAAAVTFLFAQAAGLPDPSSVDIYGILDGHAHDEAVLQFPPVAESRDALVLWALQFGSVITATPITRPGHGPEQYVRVNFTFGDVLRVEAFALIPLPETEATPGAEQASEPETVPV